MPEGYSEGREVPKEGGGSTPQPYTSGEGLKGAATPQELREAAANSDPTILDQPNATFTTPDGKELHYDQHRQHIEMQVEVTVRRPVIPDATLPADREGLRRVRDQIEDDKNKPSRAEAIGSSIIDSLLDHWDDKERAKDTAKARAKIENSSGKPANLIISKDGTVTVEPSKGRRLSRKEFGVAVELAKKWGRRLGKPWNVNTDADLPSSGIKDYDLKYNPQTGKYHEYE